MKIIIIMIAIIFCFTGVSFAQHHPGHRPPINPQIQGPGNKPHHPHNDRRTHITQTINTGAQVIIIPLDDAFKYCKDGEDVYERNVGRR